MKHSHWVLLLLGTLVAGCASQAEDSKETGKDAGQARGVGESAELVADASQATTLKPSDLSFEVSVDDRSRPGDVTKAMTRSVYFKLSRRTQTGFKGTIIIGSPVGSPNAGETRTLPFDLTADAQTNITSELAVPATLKIATFTYPITVNVDDRQFLSMDLTVVKGPGWRVVGPFDGGPQVALDKPFGPEKELDLRATYPGKGGQTIRWAPLKKQGILQKPKGGYDLNQGCADVDWATAYATTDIYAPKDMPARMAIRFDDSAKVWINGQEVFRKLELCRGLEVDAEIVDVNLRKGRNTVLLKVCDNGGGWAYHVELTNPDGTPIEGLQDTVALVRQYRNDSKLKLTDVTRDSVSIHWLSDIPNTATVRVQKAVQGRAIPRPGGGPYNDMVKADPSAKPITVTTNELSTVHEATITGLQPGTRYLVSADPAIAGCSTPPLSFYTSPESGKTQVLKQKIACVVYTNVTHRSSLDRPDAHTPVDPEQLERLKWELAQTSRFYFVNSGMRFWTDVEFFIDDTPHEIGDETYAMADSPLNENMKLFKDTLAKYGKKPSDFDGDLILSYVRRWDPNRNGGKGGWWFPHGGGGTLGPQEATGYGTCGWRASPDAINAWLMSHEFQHQLDASYHASMEPDHLFCHFQPWDDTAHDHGEHWDGIVWIFREWAGYVTREHQTYPMLEPTLGFRYFTNRWGTVLEYADADNDGIPDNAPELPLDEKRLGSSPAKQDTDGDGLSDMREVMACNWVEYGLGESWAGESKDHFCDLQNPDSDGDGLKDGVDPYPVYPVNPKVAKVSANPGTLQHFVTLNDKTIKGEYSIGWNDDQLMLKVVLDQKPVALRFCIDADDDGWFVGHDNYDIHVRPYAGVRNDNPWYVNSEKTMFFGFHNCGVLDKWPFYDYSAITKDSVTMTQSESDGKYTAEIAIAQNDANDLSLKAGEKIGILLTVRPRGGIERPWEHMNALSAFEPHTFFTVELAN